MKMKTLIVVLFLTLAPAFIVAADDAPTAQLSARSFQFRFRDAEKAAAIIKPLMSAQGSFSIQPSSNTLVITDRPDNLRSIVGMLEQFDRPPRSFRIELKLVAASRAPSAAKVPDDLKQIAGRLAGMLRFNSFEKMGDLVADGKEGDPVIIRLDSGYGADFRIGEFDPLSGTLRIHDFQLTRLQKSGKEESQIIPLLKTSLNLKVGQTVVLGASRQADSQRALMLVLVAKRTD